MIKAEGLVKQYGPLKVLNEVSLSIDPGEVVSIVGPSGAGKTTLLQIIGTLDKPDRGQVSIAGEAPFLLNDKALSAFRNRHIGFVFQFHQLLPEFTALENVCLPAMMGGKSFKEAEHRAKELLVLLDLKGRMHHKPNEMSGGEQQRVAVARALINAPSVVLADEPSGNLDSKHAQELHALFFQLRDQLNQTFVIVTHNEAFANMADRKLTMRDGQISEESLKRQH